MTPEEVVAFAREKYSPGRAANAAKRVRSYCGKWPHELVEGFCPAAWGVKISEEFATLIRLATENGELRTVLQRLKVLALKHDGPNSNKCINRQDIFKVRDWLREKGIDTNPPRLSSGNATTRPSADDDDDDDEHNAREARAESIVHAEIVAKPHGYDDDSSDSSSDGDDETVLDDEATEDDETAVREEDIPPKSQDKSTRTTLVTKFFPPSPQPSSITESRSSASRPLARSHAQIRSTTSSDSVQSPPSRHDQVNESVNAHFQNSIRKVAMAGRTSTNTSRSKPEVSSNPVSPQPDSTTSNIGPNSAGEAGPPATSSTTTPNSQAISSSNKAAPEPQVPAQTSQHRESSGNGVEQLMGATQHVPSTATKATRPDIHAASSTIPRPKTTPAKPASTPNEPPPSIRLREPTSTTGARFVLATEGADESQPVSLYSYLDGSTDHHRTTPTHPSENTSPSASTNPRVSSSSVPGRTDARSGSTSSNSTPATARPRRNIQPPSRHVHDLPLSALADRDGSRKRPRESESSVTSETSRPTTSSSQAVPRNNSVSNAVSYSQAAVNNSNAFELNPSQTQRRTNSLPSATPFQAAARNIPRPSTASLSQTVPSGGVPSSNTMQRQMNSSETAEHRPAKRQRCADTSEPSISSNGTLDFDATLPSGECFLADLRAWWVRMEPEFKRLNQIYENNLEETRKFTKITETQKAKREAAMEKVLNAKQSLDENQAEIRKTARLIQSIAPEDADGDEAATEFLQKKRKDMDDHKIVRRTFQAELVHSERELREIDMESLIIRKKLEELAAAGVKAEKEKEAMDSAVRKWMFQIRILEGTGGWTKSLEQFGADFAAGKFNGLSMPRNERP